MEIIAARRQARRRRRQRPTPTSRATTSTPSSRRSRSSSRRACRPPTSGARSPTSIAIRVTDETVPDAGKKRYTLSLSIHGIERAGAEGGTRAMEDIVTAATTEGRLDAPIVPEGSRRARRPSATSSRRRSSTSPTRTPTAGAAARCPPAPRRRLLPALQRQRRRPEPRLAGHRLRVPRLQRACPSPRRARWVSFYDDVRKNGGQFAAGDDLHGQPFADALSYTLLPHGRHRYDKNQRIQETAKTINRSTYDRIKWSPIVQANDQPQGGGAPLHARTSLGDGLREDLRPDLGLGLRHDQLHDDGRAGRLVRLGGRA